MDADFHQIAKRTLHHYDRVAQRFFHGTVDHDVSQNIGALLDAIEAPGPLTILDLGCGPGRDLKTFSTLGHVAIGLDGSRKFVDMARDFSGRGGQDYFVATAAGIELLENDPMIAVGTQKLPFGKQTVNTTSLSKAIGVFNPSGGPLAISSIVATGDFSQINNCPPVLQTLKKCTLNAAFTPTALGPRTGSVTINSNSLAGKPVVIKLTGTGD